MKDFESDIQSYQRHKFETARRLSSLEPMNPHYATIYTRLPLHYKTISIKKLQNLFTSRACRESFQTKGGGGGATTHSQINSARYRSQAVKGQISSLLLLSIWFWLSCIQGNPLFTTATAFEHPRVPETFIYTQRWMYPQFNKKTVIHYNPTRSYRNMCSSNITRALLSM